MHDGTVWELNLTPNHSPSAVEGTARVGRIEYLDKMVLSAQSAP